MAGRSVWTEALRFSLRGWRVCILLLVPAAVVFWAFHSNPVVIFGAAALALIPLASLAGDATEEMAGWVGPVLGGLLNATLGNLTELIVAFLALWSGHTGVVKASLSGSIISNLLLVFGLSALVGGWGREKQTFSRVAVGAAASMLFLASVAMVMPALFDWAVFGTLRESGHVIERLSFYTAVVLLLSYFASLLFAFRTHRRLFGGNGRYQLSLSPSAALVVLAAAATLIGLTSEILVSQIALVTRSLGWSELFVGLVIIAAVGNAAEHSSAVMMARRGKMDLALNIAVGSATQIALFVAPLLVLVSPLSHFTLSLVFHPLEIAAVILSVGVVTLVATDGETNWFEGFQLLSVYATLAVFFYFLPAPP